MNTWDARGKNILLIAAGGTLGSYTMLELLRLGASVTVIAQEELVSLQKNLRYIRERVSDEVLRRLFAEQHFDAVVDFLHYPDPELYRARLPLLAENTEHYLFLSSYRVYADEMHPLREDAPQLIDVFPHDELLAEDNYGMSKCREERILRASPYRNWTILRPLISFSRFRFDLVTLGARQLFPRAAQHKPVPLPAASRKLTAGLGWAGNAGRLIARLALNPAACQEDYIIGNDENLTWEQIADIYTEVMGLSFVWVDTEEYLAACTENRPSDRIILLYDRLYDRRVENAKVREAAGMAREEFVNFREALIYELTQVAAQPALLGIFTEGDAVRAVVERMDAYFQARGL